MGSLAAERQALIALSLRVPCTTHWQQQSESQLRVSTRPLLLPAWATPVAAGCSSIMQL